MTDVLDRELAAAAAEIARTDTKAGALLSAGGIMAAALGVITAGGHPSIPATALAAALLAAALVLSAVVIRPRLRGFTRASYLHWSTLDPDQPQHLEQLATELAEDRRPERLIGLSRLAARKMRVLRWATDTTIAAVLAIGLAAAASA